MPGNLTKKQFAVAVVSGAILLSAGMTGCDRTRPAEELLTEAKEYEQKGDRKAALIQLKNAVAQNPENAEARLRLGTLHLTLGDAPSAEKELRKAGSLGVADDKILPMLAQTLLMQGKFQPLLDEISEDKAKASALLLARRGDAFLGLDDASKSRSAYEAALALNPNLGDALSGMARHAAIGNDLATAERFADEAITRDPKNAESWMLKGSLLRTQGKGKEALAAYDKALAIEPAHRSAHIEKAYIHIGSKDLVAAKADIEAARKYSPGNLNVTYVQALLDFTAGKHSEARESLQKVLKVAPDHMPSVLLAGAVELNLDGTKQAEQHLRRYLDANPSNVYARKLLAQALLKQGQPAEATKVLSPALKDGGKDPQLLALTGQSYLQTRDFAKASVYFGQASALAPEAASIRTSLGMSKMGEGDLNEAVDELKRATTLAPKSLEAGFALVQAEVGRGQLDKALLAVQALEKEQPGSAAVHAVKGDVYLRQGDRKNARASLEKALTLEPGFFPAASALAKLDLADKNVAGAKQRFNTLLAKDKNNVDAMNALASIEMMQGRPAEATAWLEKAQAAQPQAVPPALNLAAHYLRQKQADKAQALLRKTLVANPSSPDVLDLMGQAQIVAKDHAGALESYSKLAAALPKSAQAQVRLAAVHILMKNDTAAAEDLKRALAIDPAFLPARMGQIDLASRSGKHDEALAIARQMQADDPKKVNGLLVESDLLLAQKKVAPALTALEKAFAISNSAQVLAKLSEVLALNGKAAEAEARLAKYHAAHPGNDLIAMLVADKHLAKREFKPAIAALQAALKTNPSNPTALNNLAWAYQQEADARALPTAEQAYKLNAQNPAVMDTLGWILVQKGETARGVDLLRKAVAAAPKAPEIRYHLAAGLAKSGDKAGARKEVEQSLAGGQSFAAMDEAKALLRQL
ncbi:XrtA/PEP-CTERM system TPR-repeat protein PrsT [Telluria aromaticivorans]|uniref:PEP-CTERM system TPR-repeat protein PrsT n=1 Tax=Telluria aromaticivorans TaxID=2725995 RepID=A0A7Y2K097_9BURK|nr:XrtA/PEP-CTERM system TPR-repeat protein PrsT [Telluria aromaticivorans]NNG24186.1 PEP-CTERM system TPR-repeat protein PrsT [Telluria aromaticivorans]